MIPTQSLSVSINLFIFHKSSQKHFIPIKTKHKKTWTQFAPIFWVSGTLRQISKPDWDASSSGRLLSSVSRVPKQFLVNYTPKTNMTMENPIFNRKYSKWLIFRCHVSFPGVIGASPQTFSKKISNPRLLLHELLPALSRVCDMDMKSVLLRSKLRHSHRKFQHIPGANIQRNCL